MSYINIKLFFSLLKRFIFLSENYVIYKYPFNERKSVNDKEVKLYTTIKEIPYFIKKELKIYPLVNSLYFRIKTKNAILLTIHSNNKVVSYGWIQSWKYFKRKFGWVSEEGYMLGPYWTNESYRGKGFYGKLLRKSIEQVKDNKPIFIYTSPNNKASQRGIEKAGFEKVGVFKIVSILRINLIHKEISLMLCFALSRFF